MRASVNFKYIESQRAEVRIGDRTHVVWRVGADALAQRTAWHDVGPPPPTFRGRSDLVSTDDIAWVALAWLKEAELHRKARARDEARKALRTLLALQRPDGSFVAYQTADRPGDTPVLYNAGDWMATSRALQAVGAGVRHFNSSDSALVESLTRCLERGLQRVQGTWARAEHRVGRHYVIDQMHLPAWLPYNRADAAAAIVLGLSDWYGARRDEAPLPVLRAFADALVETQKGSATQYPWEAFLPQADKPALWYPDGSLHAAALIRAREILHKPTYLSTAVRESDVLHPHLLCAYNVPWQMAPRPDLWPQVPGGPASLAINAAALYRATGKDRYGLVAALFASCLTTPFGKAGPLYDASTGRCADVLTAAGPSRTSSPGASARAIYTLLEVADTSGASHVGAVPLAHDAPPLILRAVDGRAVNAPITEHEAELPGGARRLARVAHDDAFWLKFDVGRTASYRIDMVYLKDRTSGAVVNVRLDGEAILSLPLGTADSDGVLTRLPAIGPTRLDPGLHTLGVRGNGLLLSAGSLLDVFVVQPVVAWRLWQLPDGRRVALFSNFSERDETTELPSSLGLPARIRHSSLWTAGLEPASIARGPIESTRLEDGTWRVRMPALASGMIEW